MAKFEHTPTRNIVLKESSEEELRSLRIPDAAEGFAPPPIPSAFTLRSEMTPVKDQGSLGTCTSFCVIALLEHIHRRDLSEAHLTHEAERRFGDCKEGLALVHGMTHAREPGLCDEADWPYDNVQVCWTNPPNVGGRVRFGFKGIGRVYNTPRRVLLDDINDAQTTAPQPGGKTAAIKHQMFGRRRPVAVSVPVFWRAGWSLGPDIVMPSAAMLDEFASLSSPKEDGWHCIAVVGWDDSRARFVFKNSWDRWWGDSGFGTLPYSYIERFSDIAMIGW